MNRILSHIRGNLVAYLALFVALGGTSYAAISLPNHSITPVKFNRQVIGGYVRAWASVDANGHVAGGSPGVRVVVNRSGISGIYLLSWARQDLRRCALEGGIRADASQQAPGFAVTSSNPAAERTGRLGVTTLDRQGGASSLPFFVNVVCSTP